MRIQPAGLTVAKINTMRSLARAFRYVCRQHGMRPHPQGGYQSHVLASDVTFHEYNQRVIGALHMAFPFADWFPCDRGTAMQSEFQALGLSCRLHYKATTKPERLTHANLHFP